MRSVFADKYIKNPVVVEMYGKYPYFGKRVDSDALRFNWINRKADFGYIYYIIYAMENNIKDSKTSIQKLLSDYKSEINHIRTAAFSTGAQQSLHTC